MVGGGRASPPADPDATERRPSRDWLRSGISRGGLMTEGSVFKSLVRDEAVPVRDIDTSIPHIARMYDYWLGGKDNFAADRAAAKKAAEKDPRLLDGVRGNRAFLARSVRFLAAGA